MSAPVPDDTRYAVLVPVKPPAVGKSRLAALGEPARRDLASAFAADTVAAAEACAEVSRVLVVTDDAAFAREFAELGVDVLPDGADDLNQTLVQAAAEIHRRRPELAIAALCADLPALRHHELSAAIGAAPAGQMSFVPDQEGTGTTAVLAPSLAMFAPAFGAGSRQRHRDTGAHEIVADDLAGLRRDVDDPADLRVALELGVGARTSLVVTALGLRGRLPADPGSSA